MIHDDPFAFVCDRTTQHIIITIFPWQMPSTSTLSAFYAHSHLHTQCIYLFRYVEEETVDDDDDVQVEHKKWVLFFVLLKCGIDGLSMYSLTLALFDFFAVLLIWPYVLLLLLLLLLLLYGCICTRCLHAIYKVAAIHPQVPVHTYDYENIAHMMSYARLVRREAVLLKTGRWATRERGGSQNTAGMLFVIWACECGACVLLLTQKNKCHQNFCHRFLIEYTIDSWLGWTTVIVPVEFTESLAHNINAEHELILNGAHTHTHSHRYYAGNGLGF